jgi:hypothetical protein
MYVGPKRTNFSSSDSISFVGIVCIGLVLLPILTDINVVIELSGYSSEFARLLNLPSMVCLPSLYAFLFSETRCCLCLFTFMNYLCSHVHVSICYSRHFIFVVPLLS